MKIIRCYASAENAVNVKNIIQNLLFAELESLINTKQTPENSEHPIKSEDLGRECA
ncbi:hypothetical protein [Bacillus sp. TE8-1]|uniref:hypothetical protein n=1 Tax=Bacillus sp. TE8-1 TaxID=2217829 RepID=UPI0015D01FB7|nr:hypothetical protein [Bacillus sp. TE8-1]